VRQLEFIQGGYVNDPNYPAESRRSALAMPNQFAVLTAAAYFFIPSLTELRTSLTV
jgi:hypothetical protein